MARVRALGTSTLGDVSLIGSLSQAWRRQKPYLPLGLYKPLVWMVDNCAVHCAGGHAIGRKPSRPRGPPGLGGSAVGR